MNVRLVSTFLFVFLTSLGGWTTECGGAFETEFIGVVVDSRQAQWDQEKGERLCEFKLMIEEEYQHIRCPFEDYWVELSGFLRVYDNKAGCPVKNDNVSGRLIQNSTGIVHDWGWDFVAPRVL